MQKEVPSSASSETIMKSLFAKTDKSLFVKLRYLRLKIKKNKEINKNFCVTFDHNFKNIPLYVMSNISFERYYMTVTLHQKCQKWTYRLLQINSSNISAFLSNTHFIEDTQLVRVLNLLLTHALDFIVDSIQIHASALQA